MKRWHPLLHPQMLRHALATSVAAVVLMSGAVVAAPTQGKTKSKTAVTTTKGKLAKRKKRRRVKPKPEDAPPPEEAAAPIQTNSRRPSRVDFDERLIKGETNKADAIYLFERRSSEMRSLVKKRKHFHPEIDETLQ